MEATKIQKNQSGKAHLTVDTEQLQELLNCGRKTAVEIGIAAEARITVGRRVLWNVRRIERYLDTISE